MSRATESVLAEREALIKRVKELEDEVACLKLRNENLLDVTEGMKAGRKEELLRTVDACFHAFASAYRLDAREMVEEILAAPPKEEDKNV